MRTISDIRADFDRRRSALEQATRQSIAILTRAMAIESNPDEHGKLYRQRQGAASALQAALSELQAKEQAAIDELILEVPATPSLGPLINPDAPARQPTNRFQALQNRHQELEQDRREQLQEQRRQRRREQSREQVKAQEEKKRRRAKAKEKQLPKLSKTYESIVNAHISGRSTFSTSSPDPRKRVRHTAGGHKP